MTFWRRIWQRDAGARLAACTALDVGTEFAKALVFDIDVDGHGTVRGVGRKRQGLAHMQSGTVADIAAVVDNCAVALQEAEEMAGFRPTQVVIGIAGELVKGFTTTHSQERRKPDQPITEAELQRLIDAVQREALMEAERAITWETGLPQVDVRLVHAAVTGASIDGYALTNPVGFQGRHIKIGIFNAFAPLVHLGALQSVASQLDLELLEIVAEPYAVARVLGSDQIRQAGALFVDVGGGTTDVALVRQGGIEGTRMFALGGRAFTKSFADRLDLPFPRAESLKVDYARGLPVERSDEVAAIVADDVRVWAAGVELVMEELSGGDLLPGRIFLCGGGSRLPEVAAALASEAFYQRLPFARPPEVTVMAPDQIDTISDATELLVDQQDVTPLGLAYQAIELQTTEDALDVALRRVLQGDEGLGRGRSRHLPGCRRRDHLGRGADPVRRGRPGRRRAAVRLAGRDLADQLPAAVPRRARPTTSGWPSCPAIPGRVRSRRRQVCRCSLRWRSTRRRFGTRRSRSARGAAGVGAAAAADDRSRPAPASGRAPVASAGTRWRGNRERLQPGLAAMRRPPPRRAARVGPGDTVRTGVPQRPAREEAGMSAAFPASHEAKSRTSAHRPRRRTAHAPRSSSASGSSPWPASSRSSARICCCRRPRSASRRSRTGSGRST